MDYALFILILYTCIKVKTKYGDKFALTVIKGVDRLLGVKNIRGYK
jgi:hypothetical protein